MTKSKYNISIISSSVRTDRKSHNVALYFQKYFTENNLANSEILDLKQYNFPIFEERFENLQNPNVDLKNFVAKIINSDGIMILTPEYNGSIPSSLKNVIDLLYEEWHRKPICFSTVSSGEFGGLQALTHLQSIFWKVRAWTFTANFPVSKVEDKYTNAGIAINIEESNKYANVFINEFFNCIQASRNNTEI